MIPGEQYLVGGAVRDEMLGIDPRERDWVVTGATPKEMKKSGFRQVGASFPVFLHPRNGEEYALARTERKSGHGYHGFSVDFGPGVGIEQDLEPSKFIDRYDLIKYLAGKKDNLVAILIGVHSLR